MLVQVTKQDIEFGKPSCSTSCPVATALRRAMPDTVVSVGVFKVVAWMGGVGGATVARRKHADKTVMTLPPIATAWITAYDMRPTAAQPFAFEI